MKKILLIILSLTTLNISASVLDKKIEYIKNNVDVGTNGGEVLLLNKSFKKSDYRKLVPELLKKINESECSYRQIIGTEALKENYYSLNLFSGNSKIFRSIQEMVESKEIIGAIGYYWDNVSGMSEYCSTEKIEIFFNNGKSLYINFDSTT